MLAVVIAEGVAIAVLALLVLGLLRSHALILRALHELGAGLELEKDAGDPPSAANPVRVDIESGVVPATRPATVQGHAVVGTTLAGEEVTIPVQGSGRRTLLAFLSSGCSVCQTFWDELSTGVRDVPGDGRLVVVAKDPHDESVTRLRELAGPGLEVVQSSAAWSDYAVPGSPYFVYVEDGTITGEGSSTTWAQVRDLMRQAVGDAAQARRRAGRTGPGALTGAPGHQSPLGPMDDYADVARVDRELLSAGITPGHTSLYENPDDETASR
ncbi:hypothetical protein [Angustibacter sp. Root456]|uniref:hypothetical protein n=1 Tax=Angustibacter sp. Root456 TaxID=1736539 RepID=UPI0006FF2E58|nr:hypothetical protein [Angustibacter sp. Root456]KQX66047.1 hypothetical protein ASD06_06530 [Angustibacter sp. Root456]